MPEETVAALLRSRASTVQKTIFDSATAAAAVLGVPLYLVGGAVRDLLATGQLHDLDLTVEGDAIELARRLADELDGRLVVHEHFSTASLTVDEEHVDLVTARREEYPEPASLPQIEPGELHDDLYRRDFSVNAMAIRLWPDGDGDLIDPFDGRADLSRRQLRVLHDQSFLDDPTRILRGVRLGTRLELELESRTAELAVAAIAGGAFEPLSGTRLGRELGLLLEDRRPVESLATLDHLGFYRVVERSAPFGVDDFDRLRAIMHLRRHDEASVDGAIGCGSSVSWWLAGLIGLYRSESETTRARLARRLLFEGSRAELFVGSGGRLDEVERLVGQSDGPTAEIARALDRLAPEESIVLQSTLGPGAFRRVEQWLDDWRATRLSIDGEDLIAAGFSSGPAIGLALDATLAARREGRIDVDEELEFALAQLVAARSNGEDV